MEPAGMPAIDLLRLALGRRGWSITPLGSGVSAHKREWPAALKLVVDPGDDLSSAVLGVMVDFRALPLRGERFRDILNSERAALMHGLGPLRVRHLRHDQSWTHGVSGSAFTDSAGDGLGRHAQVVLFDRSPHERGTAFVDVFAREFVRVVDFGNGIAHLLRRTYPWAILHSDDPVAGLPETVTAGGRAAQPEVVGGDF